MLYLKQYEPNKKRIAALNFDNPNEGDQKVFCSPSFGLPNPRRLTSATPIRGISRPGAVPSGLFSRPLAAV